MLIVAGLFLFTHLGHYALWDDESMDALSARGVLQTGDTTAQLGQNIVGYRNGLLLVNMRHEAMPPFTAYVTAASMKFFGENAFAARLPLAACGLGCVALMLWWLRKSGASLIAVGVFALALIGNVSFFLYARQCHYYGATMFFYVAIAFLYLHWEGRRGMLAAMGVASALLMSANPSFFVTLSVCLLADYLIWQRKVRAFKFWDLVVLFLPQLIMGLILLKWWNPLHTQLGSYLGRNTLEQRLTLFCWNLRDINRCEMIVGVLLLAAPFVAFMGRHTWLKRALLGFGIYVAVMTVMSTQIVDNTTVADVRYLSAILPLCIAIEAFTLCALTRKMTKAAWVAIPLAAVAFGTNLLHGGMFFAEGVRSTLASFVGELAAPPADPYTATAQWIEEHVREGESIWVSPDYACYPLMFHAPKAIYAWQLTPPAQGQFASLAPIHFQGMVPPDYVIAFGPVVQQVAGALQGWNRASYRVEEVLNVFWKDLYRPELFWRRFEPVRNFDPQKGEGIYIFKRMDGPAAPAR